MNPAPNITRRQSLRLLTGAGGLIFLSSCSSNTSTADGSSTPQPIDMDNVELEAEVRDLHVRLWAASAVSQIIAGTTTDVYSFDAEVLSGDPASVTPSGSYLGPTLHVRQGQRVRVSFENQLAEECIVHWHGLTLPQDQDGQPGDAVDSGETYEYDFTITNEPGTYWYHPHPHGRTGEQVYRGLAGLLIVHGDSEGLPDGDNDLSLVLQDRTIREDGTLQYTSSMHDTMAGFVGDTLVTNGVTSLEIAVRPEPYRIRLLNGANSRTQYLTWSTANPCHVVATDGHLLPQTVTTPGIVLTPAQRTDLWINFAEFTTGDRIELLVADTFVESVGMMGQGMGADDDMGSADINFDAKVVATFIVSEGDADLASVPTKLGADPAFSASDAVNVDAPKQFVLSTRRAAHWINDTQWEGRKSSAQETVQANTVELWEFVNQSPMPHPMHLHGNAFRVVSRTWDDDAVSASWDTIDHGIIESGLRDTVLVWPGQRVQIAIPFAEHKGFFMYHCHILEHEDAGMMRNFEVV